MLTEADVLDLIRARIAKSNQRTVANDLGVSFQYLNDVLLGRRKIAKTIGDALGIEKKEFWQYKEEA